MHVRSLSRKCIARTLVDDSPLSELADTEMVRLSRYLHLPLSLCMCVRVRFALSLSLSRGGGEERLCSASFSHTHLLVWVWAVSMLHMPAVVHAGGLVAQPITVIKVVCAEIVVPGCTPVHQNES